MKHVGYYLDKIQMEMMHIPRQIDTDDNVKRAHDVLAEVRSCEKSLIALITHSSFRSKLNLLENSSMQEIKLQAHEIEELFKSLEHMLYELDLYLKNLYQILEQKNSAQWLPKYDQIVVMIDQKFGGERGDLRKEFQVVLHTREELKEILSAEELIQHFLE